MWFINGFIREIKVKHIAPAHPHPDLMLTDCVRSVSVYLDRPDVPSCEHGQTGDLGHGVCYLIQYQKQCSKLRFYFVHTLGA